MNKLVKQDLSICHTLAKVLLDFSILLFRLDYSESATPLQSCCRVDKLYSTNLVIAKMQAFCCTARG